MVLTAAVHKACVSFGYTNNSGLDRGPVKFNSPDQIEEAKVASSVVRVNA